jgi:hypothetical protein
MIGRMKPILNVLDAESHAHYKAHYCGICAAAKTVHGRRSSLGHSSELVFVSLILEGLAEEPYRAGRVGCTALPLIPRKVARGPGSHGMAVAAGLLATLQLDLDDAREDRERRLKRFFCRPLAGLAGPIDPRAASGDPEVRRAIAHLPDDPVGATVAGVIGSVFRLAGLGERLTADGCRIGHALGRLMDLSDALDDYHADATAGRPNPLRGPEGVPPDPDAVGRALHAILDELDDLVAGLPLRRNADLAAALVNVHARARVESSLAEFRRRAGLPPGEPFACVAGTGPGGAAAVASAGHP